MALYPHHLISLTPRSPHNWKVKFTTGTPSQQLLEMLVSNSNANANANYAEYLSRKATMERQQQQLQLQQLQLQQQQQAMLMGNNAVSTPAITGNNADDKSNAPSNTGGKDQDDCVAV